MINQLKNLGLTENEAKVYVAMLELGPAPVAEIAQKAGIKAGDVIVQLGDHPVTDLQTYMQALGKFKKGDKTKVKYKRGTELMEAPVEF